LKLITINLQKNQYIKVFLRFLVDFPSELQLTINRNRRDFINPGGFCGNSHKGAALKTI